MHANLDDERLEHLIVYSEAAQEFELLKNRILEYWRRHNHKTHITLINPSWINNDVKQSNARHQRAYDESTDGKSAEYFAARQLVKRAVKQDKRNMEINVARLCKN